MTFAYCSWSTTVDLRPVTDWIIGRAPDTLRGPLDVWMKGGFVRHADQSAPMGFPIITLDDGTIADRWDVMGWRPSTREPEAA